MKLKFLLFAYLICFYSYADINILVSTNPSSESNTLIPNTQNTFDPDKIFSSLEQAHGYVLNTYGTNLGSNLTIHIRGGLYYQKAIFWRTTSNNFTFKIINYNKEKVIFDGTDFDGTLHLKFINLAPVNRRTNFWIEGLIIQNYVNAISLGQTALDDNCEYITTIQNSNNVIKNNVFKNIGNKNTPEPDVNGYSALGLSNSTNNLIESNVFFQIENKENYPIAVHALYIVNYSNNNLIKNNYISLCDKSPIKIRNASNYNRFERNYIEQSGNADSSSNTGFFEAWYCDSTDSGYITDCNDCEQNSENRKEEPSKENTLIKNVCTFPYPRSNEEITLYASKWGDDTFTVIDNFVISEHPDCEEISATTSGDINGDGIEEIFVAFNYGSFTKLVRSRPETPHYLSKVLYVSEYWHIGALEMNDFDNSGTPELITAFNALTNNNDNTQIYKGDGVNSVSNYGSLYSHPWWKTASITSGDYDNDGTTEIFTAYNAPDSSGTNNTQIFKGTGTGVTPLENLGKVYRHNWWLTKLMVTGDFDGNGFDEIYIAYNAPDSSGTDNTQIFKGTGTGATPLGNFGKAYHHNWWHTATMTSGDFNGNGLDEIVIAYNAPDNSRDYTTQIYRGDGVNSISNYGQLYRDFGWRTGIMISGEFESSNGDELMISLVSNTKSQSYISTGTGAITNLGLFHRTDEIIPCTQNLFLKTSPIQYEQKRLKDDKTFIYPNPTNKFSGFTISGLSGNYQIKIYSNTGRLIKSYLNQHTINTQNLASGLYIIKIVDSTKTVTRKVIIE